MEVCLFPLLKNFTGGREHSVRNWSLGAVDPVQNGSGGVGGGEGSQNWFCLGWSFQSLNLKAQESYLGRLKFYPSKCWYAKDHMLGEKGGSPNAGILLLRWESEGQSGSQRPCSLGQPPYSNNSIIRLCCCFSHFNVHTNHQRYLLTIRFSGLLIEWAWCVFRNIIFITLPIWYRYRMAHEHPAKYTISGSFEIRDTKS